MPETARTPSWGRVLRTLSSARLRAALGIGVVLGIGSVSTLAAWTDDVSITGTTFSAGVLDLEVNNLEAYATTTLGMSAMVPGNTSAEILTIKNGGTVPLTYTLTGGLTGTNASAYSSNAALVLTVKTGATRSGSGNTATCNGGTSIYSAALTTTTTTAIINTGRLVAVGGTEPLCFQVTFSATAPSTLQGNTATATFTATGSSDV